MTLAASMHLLDRSEPDIRLIVQIKADVGQNVIFTAKIKNVLKFMFVCAIDLFY